MALQVGEFGVTTPIFGYTVGAEFAPPPPADAPVKEARMPFQYTCENCGKPFTRRVRRSRHNPARFCSHACRAKIGAQEWHAANPAEARFWAKVAVAGPDECWPWQAGRISYGYGSFTVNGRLILAHRFSWSLANGRDAGEARVLHSCDNPPCCNPAHLHLGTQQDNIDEMMSRGRHVAPSGESHPCARVSATDVREIRCAHASGESAISLGRRFGVSGTQIIRIARGRAWASVPLENCDGNAGES